MRSRSKKTAAIYRQWAAPRREFVESGYCCLCGGSAVDCHEILAGAHRMRAFVERCCWLRTCRLCHDKLQTTPTIRQLALKLLSDPECFDLALFHVVWSRPTTAITPAEVLESLRQLLIERNTP